METNSNMAPKIYPENHLLSTNQELSTSYKRYALFILVLVSVFNAIDKMVFSALLEPIKQEFELSDLQLGIVSGLAFSLFYATLGLPFARWADMGNRRIILSVTVGFWSLMTVITGLVQNFTQMFLARVGVGVGEGGGHPAALSMLSDLYSTKRGGVAVSLFLIGGTVGSVLGIAGGAAIAEEYGWRMALIWLGAPGLILAILIAFTIKEPRKSYKSPTLSDVFGRRFWESSKSLFRKKSFFHCIIGFTIFAVYGQGSGQWTLSYLVRNFNLTLSEAGNYLGIVLGLSSVIGILFGGLISNYIGSKNVKWYVYFPMIVIALLVPVCLGIYSSSSLQLTLSLIGLSGALVGIMTPTIFSLVFGISGQNNKALGIAILGMLATLVGGGGGPMIIGGLSDFLSNYLAEESLKYSLILSVMFMGISLVSFFCASKTIQSEFETTE